MLIPELKLATDKRLRSILTSLSDQSSLSFVADPVLHRTTPHRYCGIKCGPWKQIDCLERASAMTAISDPDPGVPDVVAAARRLSPQIVATRDETERLRRIPQELADALAGAGLY